MDTSIVLTPPASGDCKRFQNQLSTPYTAESRRERSDGTDIQSDFRRLALQKLRVTGVTFRSAAASRMVSLFRWLSIGHRLPGNSQYSLASGDDQ